MAKESADIVLQNDDFSNIVEAVKWGRNVYETILKYLQFQFTVTWVAIIVVIVGACVTKVSLGTKSIKILYIKRRNPTFLTYLSHASSGLIKTLSKNLYSEDDATVAIR